MTVGALSWEGRPPKVRIVPLSHGVLVVALLALSPGAANATTATTLGGLADGAVVDADVTDGVVVRATGCAHSGVRPTPT
jgi:hypothetical protein